MRIPGYCTGCHRPRVVQVSSQGLLPLAQGGVALGVCQDCEDTEVVDRAKRNVLQALRAGPLPQRNLEYAVRTGILLTRALSELVRERRVKTDSSLNYQLDG